MERVYILAPYNADDGAKSLELVIRLCEMAKAVNLAPVAPQFYLWKMFDPRRATQYCQAQQMQCAILQGCDLVWIYGEIHDQYLEPMAIAVDRNIPMVQIGNSIGSCNAEHDPEASEQEGCCNGQ